MWLRRAYSVCSHGSPTDVSLPGWQPVPSASFFFGVRIMLGTILARFSIIYFRGLALRIKVMVWVIVRARVRVWVRVGVGVGVRVSVVLWSW